MLNNIARIQRALTQTHLDAILLNDENDRRFATGFPSSDGAVIVTVHQAFFITDARYIEAARAALTGIAQVLLCSREAPMRTLVQGILREAMEDGAAGFSTGLIYTPSCYAEEKEIIELAKVIAPFNGIYASHMRNEKRPSTSAVRRASSWTSPTTRCSASPTGASRSRPSPSCTRPATRAFPSSATSTPTPAT